MEENEATVEKKKGSWSKLGDIAIFTSPSGKEARFDFTKLSKDVLAFYGGKQWISDQVAGEKTEEDKLAGMKAAYKEAVEKGLELSITGKIGIVGKIRSNAAAGTALKAAKSMIELLMKKVKGEELTEEEEKSLAEMTARAKEQKEKK